MRSRLWLGVVFLSAVTLWGCRDIVVPEREGADPELTLVRVVGLGSDGLLRGAIVTLDNRAYVSGVSAGEWSAETVGGVAWFVDLPAGTYDASVEPPQRNTPAWDVVGVVIDSTEVTLAYEGIPFAVNLAWFELEDLGVAPAEVRVRARYELPRPNSAPGTYRASQVATFVSEGRYEGVLPWPGRFRLEVEVPSGSAPLSDVGLEYTYPDSLELPGAAPVTLDSPLRKQPITVVAAGAPFVSAPVRIRQGLLAPDDWFAHSLSFEFAPATSDSVYLLPPEYPQLEVVPIESPRFLRQRRYLAADQTAPGAFDLGDHILEIYAVDSGGQPVVGASFEVFSETASGVWSDAGSDHLDILLHAGRHSVTVWAAGYLAANELFIVDRDATLVVALEEE